MKKHALERIAACMVLFFTIMITPAYANKATYPIGEIIALEGKAYYVGDNGKSVIKRGDPIYFNSNIETGAGAKALILFIDDTEITLAENSTLTIDEYVFDPYDANENKGEFSVLKGAFLWTSGMISKKDAPDVTINTSHGSIGIRGTTVWGGATDSGYGVFTAHGLVRFAGEWGKVDIPEGKGFILSDKNKALPSKESSSWEKTTLDKALNTITFSSAMQNDIERSLSKKKKANIMKRHDFRGRMFPYKTNPFKKKYKAEDDDFFSEEFKNMGNK